MGLSNFFVRDGKKEKVPVVKALNEEPAVSAAPAASAVEIKGPDDEIDLIDALLHGKDIVTKLDTEYGEFELKFPSGADILRIAHRRAAFLGGNPDESFDRGRRMMFEMWATLDVLVTKKPEKFAALSSWADCPDPDLVEDLFERGSRFCGEIRSKIKESRPRKPA